ncbi:hypothetical protein [Methylobacter svalbardensis]|uniref:hypothetical protein n=1 Tax=Methylobacter svalbardensis TaxID=3080016 RepID=UPI0030EF5236
MKLHRNFCIDYMDVDKRREQAAVALVDCTPSALFNKTAQLLLLTLLIFCPINVFAANTWSYHQEKDRLSNETYSFAQSPLPPRGLYDYLRLEIICKENTLQVAIDANSLIASQGRTFGFEYQIDNKPAVTLQMTTFKDSKRRGYTEEYAQRIVNDLLTGKSLFIRVNTMIRKVLSATILLEGAAEPVKQVASDCGLSLADNATTESAYSLAEFEQELSKLTPEQQRQVLSKIKTIIIETQKALLIEK